MRSLGLDQFSEILRVRNKEMTSFFLSPLYNNVYTRAHQLVMETWISSFLSTHTVALLEVKSMEV